MKYFFSIRSILIIAMIFPSGCYAESSLTTGDMNPEKLYSIIKQYSNDVKVNNNAITFSFKKVTLHCISDANADRMRIISPIAKASELNQELLLLALKANYHTVLDARYAIGDDILYAAFIHPLSSITQQEIESAIRQVSTSNLTFGTSFSSGELLFPGNSAEEEKKPQGKSM